MSLKDETERLVKAIKKHTTKWENKYFKEDETQSAKAKKLSKILDSLSFTKADKTGVAKLVSELSGEKVVLAEEEDIEFRPIVALVLTKLNTTDAKHGYETERVLLSIGDGTAISPEGTVGSYIPKKKDIMRPATAKEIDSISKEQLSKIREEVIISFEDD